MLSAVEAGEAASGLVSKGTSVGVLKYGGEVDPVFYALWGRAIVRFLFLFPALGRVARAYNRNGAHLNYSSSLESYGLCGAGVVAWGGCRRMASGILASLCGIACVCSSRTHGGFFEK